MGGVIVAVLATVTVATGVLVTITVTGTVITTNWVTYTMRVWITTLVWMMVTLPPLLPLGFNSAGFAVPVGPVGWPVSVDMASSEPSSLEVAEMRGVGVDVRVGVMVAVLVMVGVADGYKAACTFFAGPEIQITK